MKGKDSNSGNRKKKSWKRRLLKWGIGLFVFLAVAMVASVEVTSRSSFCGTCHIMEPYYESWHEDVHSEAECIECHIPPGATNYIGAKLNGLGQVVDDWLNRTSTKPSASVSVMACTREGCHDMAKVDTSDSTERGYFFDHSRHLGIEYKGIAIKCTTCHSHIKGQKHFEVNTNVCITCHLKPAIDTLAKANTPAIGIEQDDVRQVALRQGEHHEWVAPSNCTSCHNPPSEPFVYEGLEVDHEAFLANGAACESCHRNTTISPPPVSDAQCLTCHVFGLSEKTDVVEMHRVHTEGEHKVECFNCHGVFKHGPSAQIMTLNEFDCTKCHSNQHQVQRSAYLNGNGHAIPHAEDESLLISPMFLAHVDCTGCHVKTSEVSVRKGSGELVKKAQPEACDTCHQPGFGARMVPLWQQSTRSLYDSVAELLPTESNDWSLANAEAGKLVTEARELMTTVRTDGSWGVHNPRYTQLLLEQARGKLLKAKALVTDADGDGS